MEKRSFITKKLNSFRFVLYAIQRNYFRQQTFLYRGWFLLSIGIFALIPNGFAADTPSVPAFPGAEGYGAVTRGGRGGKVIMVTNLNDSGPGSLREACEAEGPRIVVFRVSGTITLESPLKISNPYITIAGQTAPGDGICLKRYQLSIDASEVIIRYIRVRLGNETDNDADAISGRYHKNIILDHLSASWSIDETVSIYRCENVTIQWCLISESLHDAGHVKGTHGFGGIWGSNYSTYHHNLLAHHGSRNPRFSSGCGYNDFRNNVVYNWGYNSAYGGEREDPDRENLNFAVINMVANYYKPGPATRPGEVTHRIVNPYGRNSPDGFGKWYIADNVVHGNPAVTANNWDGGVQPQGGSTYLEGLKLDQPFAAMPINQQTAEEAYYAVLDSVGASLPKRDAVDARIVDETRNGYATYEGAAYENNKSVPDKSKKCGIIDSQNDVGGWPELKSLPAPADGDGDGMPDEWEKKYGLDPGDASNTSKDTDSDGYTNIEEYLNGTDPTAFVDYTKPENNVNTLQ
ncbi:MAG: pectate lyase [Candidatus Poribacteria bacterium]|nr:pectate lyase [Candidatus Poribacteria bacterium]